MLHPGPAIAQQLKIGFVNTQRIFRDAPVATQAAHKLEQEFARRDQELQDLSHRLQALQKSLDKNSATMADTDRINKEREFADLSRDFQRKQRAFREDLSLRQSEENAIIIERANKVIRSIAESENFDLILQDVVWISPRLDITERIIDGLSSNP